MESLQDFEWDENKNASNQEKHGLDFVFAAQIFEGTVLEGPDNRVDYGEIRTVALGETEGIVLVVIYTLRGTRKRLISARKAKPKEREVYYASKAQNERE